jgi:hypothetical protein
MHLLLKFYLLLFILFSLPTYAVEPPSEICIKTSSDETCTSNTSPISDDAVKWHPGHYMLNQYTKAFSNPNIKGAQRRYFWRELEPIRGEYDFSQIEKDLKEFRANNKHLFIYLEYKAFNTQARALNCAPQYIWDLGGVGVRYYDDVERYADRGHEIWKCVAQVYKEPVADSVVALIRALGKRFNNETYIEGLILPETAGTGGDGKNQTIVNNYFAALNRINTEAKKAFPNSLVFLQANSVPGGDQAMKNVMEQAQKAGIGVGGPDIKLFQETPSAKFHSEFAGKMPLRIGNERALRISGDSPSKAFDYAITDINGLRVNYIFWAGHNVSPWNFENDIIPMLKKNNWIINSACPSNIKCNTK